MLDIFERLIGDKKEYREMMARVKALPDDYRFVYEKAQKYMWNFTAGDGMDMLKVQYDLIDLFEAGAAEGRPVLDITGKDVASFCDELIRDAKTQAGKLREKLNREIAEKLGGEEV